MIYLGDAKIGKIYLGNSEIGKAYLGSALVYQKGGGPEPPSPTPDIPTGYTKLTYAEVPLGSQAHLLTGVAAGDNIGFEIDALSYDEVASTNYGCIFGGRYQSNSIDYQLNTYSSNGRSGLIRLGGSSQNYDAHLPNKTRFRAILSGTDYTIGGVTYSGYNANISSGRNICLFALNTNGSISQHGHCRIYRFILTNNGTAVLDYVPARRNNDNVVGFYDVVAEAFITPNSGTLVGV